jgi:hypothetical protein
LGKFRFVHRFLIKNFPKFTYIKWLLLSPKMAGGVFFGGETQKNTPPSTTTRES